MAETDKALKYRIETAADLAAAKEAVRTFEELNEETAKSAPTAEETRRALQEMGREVVDVGTKTKATGGFIGNVGRELGKVQRESAKATQSMEALGKAGNGLNNVLTGLSRGGLGGIGQAAAGAKEAVIGLATGALGPVLLGALAAAGAGFIAYKKILGDIQAEMKKWADQDARVAAASAENQAKMAKAAKEALDLQLERIAETADGYDQLGNAIDRAAARIEALRAAEQQTAIARVTANEQQALAGVTEGPDAEARRKAIREAAEIERQRIVTAGEIEKADNALLKTKVEQEAAESALAKSTGALNAARERALIAEQDYEQALRAAAEFRERGGDINSEMGASYRAGVRDAAANRDNARNNLAEVEAQNLALQRAAEQRREEADLANQLAEKTRERVALEEQTRAAQQRIAAATEAEARAREVKRLENEARASYERGDLRATAEAEAAARKLREQGEQQTANVAAAAESIKAVTAALPPPVDTKPVADSVITYHGVNIRLHEQSRASLIDLGKTVRDQAEALNRLTTRVENLKASSS